LPNENDRSPQNSLLAQAVIEVAVGGSGAASPQPSSNPGLRVFVVENDNPGTEVTITCRVGPFGPMTRPLLDVKQKYKFVLIAGKRGGRPSKALEAIPEGGRLIHPRCLHNVGISTGSGLDFRLTIDAEFICVTEYLRKYRAAIDRQSIGIEALNELAASCQCKLDVIEYTRNEMCHAWVLMRSRTFDARADTVNVLIFYRPELIDATAQYKCSDDAPYERIQRYLQREPQPGMYYKATNALNPLYPFRDCGFDEQIASSGKPLIALFPIPHRTDFGALKDQRLTARGGILERLLRALWAEGLVGVGQTTAPKVKRLALSGFSMGGDICLDAFKANREKVDELYLFDPGQGIPGDVVSWITAKPQERCLRMIGTAYSEEPALRLGASLRISGTVPSQSLSVYPGDGAFWYKDSGYFRALSDPAVGAERLNKEGDAPTTPSTVKSNLFLADERPAQPPAHSDAPLASTVTLAAHWTDASGRRQTAQQPLTGISSVEAASLVRHHIIDVSNGGAPVTSSQQFYKVITAIQHNDWNQEQPRIKALRHEWAVIGGTNSSGHFTGYLQMCLRDSRFT
jgi:hypothetical protein